MSKKGSKSSPSRDYNRGYNEGVSGKPNRSVGTVAGIIDSIIPGPSIDTSGSYKKGYTDGKTDKKR